MTTPPPVDASDRTKRYRLILAEDEAGLREVLAEILEVAFDVVSVCSGEEAVDCLADTRPDVALFDVNLGDLTGLEVVRIARVELELELPCLLMTARPDNDLLSAADRLGVAEVLAKPFPRRDLVRSVSGVMARSYGETGSESWFDPTCN